MVSVRVVTIEELKNWRQHPTQWSSGVANNKIYVRIEDKIVNDVKKGRVSMKFYECRCAVSILGTCNQSSQELEAIDYNPFDTLFHDNYCKGFGFTLNNALTELYEDIKLLTESIWNM